MHVYRSAICYLNMVSARSFAVPVRTQNKGVCTMQHQLSIQKCGHCDGSGTCRSGENQHSCAVCARNGLFMKHTPAIGLVCSICKGTSFIEPVALRFKHRTGPVLAIFIMSTAIVTVIYGHKEHFSEVLAFLGTLTGAITGFYFSKKG